MFEMFALLINLLVLPISDAMVTCYLLSFYLHVWSSPTQRILQTIFYITYLRICRGNLPQKFAMAICRENMPQGFAVAIWRGFFVFANKFIFVYVSKSCLYGSKPFIYMRKTFLFVRFSLLTVLLFVTAMAVRGHHNYHSEKVPDMDLKCPIVI